MLPDRVVYPTISCFQVRTVSIKACLSTVLLHLIRILQKLMRFFCFIKLYPNFSKQKHVHHHVLYLGTSKVVSSLFTLKTMTDHLLSKDQKLHSTTESGSTEYHCYCIWSKVSIRVTSTHSRPDLYTALDPCYILLISTELTQV